MTIATVSLLFGSAKRLSDDDIDTEGMLDEVWPFEEPERSNRCFLLLDFDDEESRFAECDEFE